MNTQEIITPIGKAMEWSFENILVPMSDPINAGFIVLSFVGLGIWLRMQKKYNDQADTDGTMA
jgi:hypothetical protein